MAKIMVVDDEKDLRFMVRAILKNAGHEVIEAASGHEALETLKKTKPDLILLDVMMPELDGWETLELIKKQDALKDIPVSMLTVKKLTSDIIIQKNIEELVDYIHKPFQKDSLVKKVKSDLDSVESIKRKKEQYSAEIVDKLSVVTYEVAAKREKLHENIFSTLKEELERAGESADVGDIKSIMTNEKLAIKMYRTWRKEIEDIIIENKVLSSIPTHQKDEHT